MKYYRDFLESLEEEKEKKELKEKLKTDSEITIVKEKNLTRLTKFLIYKFEDVGRIIFTILIFIIISIGITVILNAETRTQLINLIKNSIF